MGDYAVDDPQFRRTMGTLLGPPLVAGNSVEPLVNGDEIFPAMLEAIHSAQRTITFETFVYWSGDAGQAIAEALAERARAGVRVHVLIDAIGGAWIDRSYVKSMQAAGAEVAFYHALELIHVGSVKRLDNRTHRKLLVVDGRVGFIGGVGIADAWEGHAQDKDHWRDTQYRVRGPVVAQLQAVFMDTWMETTGEVLDNERYFPALEPCGDLDAQMFMSSYRDGTESMQLMYLLSIASARRSVRLSSAYFVPDELMCNALTDARRRGVTVQIIIPGPVMDPAYVRRASRARWGALLREGVEIYEYQPTMYHCKGMIVDDLWASIGSSNLDNRSFWLNDEANLNVLNASFALQQSRQFDEDLTRSKQIRYEDWRSRSLIEKALDGFASLFGREL
jgi:cardiolipin synthase